MPLQFPATRDSWRFDLAGLLAIIGEAAVAEVSQPLTVSPWVYLPRLLPAPHALIRPDRMARLPLNTGGKMMEVRSGRMREYIPYFADIIHPIDAIDLYSVQVLSLRTQLTDSDAIKLSPRLLGPLNLLTLFSFLLTIGLLVWAIELQDGCALMAIILLALASSATSIATRWQVRFPVSRTAPNIPPEEIVIYTATGSFILVQCPVHLARRLYWNSWNCQYVVDRSTYQILVSLGTMLLMFGIVFIANCTWTMQVALGASYLLLNGLYLLAALSRRTVRRWLWDLKSIHVSQLPPRVAGEPSETQRRSGLGENGPTYRCDTFTAAIWRVIFETKEVEWIRAARITPNTVDWDEWLQQALTAAEAENDAWDPEAALRSIMNSYVAAEAAAGDASATVATSKDASQAAEAQMRKRFRHADSDDDVDDSTVGQAATDGKQFTPHRRATPRLI